MAEAGRLLGEERYTAAAVRAATTITDGLLAEDGTLQRSWKDGRAVGGGVLEDYAHLAEGLLALYETTFDERWFSIARGLADQILARFEDPAGGFFDTAVDHETLITRPKDPQDNAVPSGGAMATTVLLRLAAWTGEGRYREAAERALGTVAPFLVRYPTGFAQWLVAAAFAASDVVEVAVVGEPAEAATQELLAPVWGRGGRPGAGGRAGSELAGPWCRCWPIAWPWAVGPRPTSAATSRATCPSPMRPRCGPDSAGEPPARRAASGGHGRPAAAGAGGPEVLLTHRPASMAFAGDMHVFPGGRVDAVETDPALRSPGP